MSSDETRLGPAPFATADDRTLVTSPAAGAARPFAATGITNDFNRTQVGMTLTCPVCKSTTPSSETYCGDCGFLLAATVSEPIETPVEEAPPAELVDEATGRRYRLRLGVNTVGRQGTDVLGTDPTISRLHARIIVESNSVTVEDLGSSNGAKVGSQRIGPNQPTPATHGMPISFGSWRLTLHMAAWEELAPIVEPTVAMAADGKTHLALRAAPERSIPGAAVALLKKVEGPLDDVPIYLGSITIGRRSSNLVPIPQDAYVSGRHAEIIADDTGVFLMDLGSTNGTQVNDQKLTPNERTPLREGDDIRIGQNRFQVILLQSAPTEPPPSEPNASPEAAPAESAPLPEPAASVQTEEEAS